MAGERGAGHPGAWLMRPWRSAARSTACAATGCAQRKHEEIGARLRPAARDTSVEDMEAAMDDDVGIRCSA